VRDGSQTFERSQRPCKCNITMQRQVLLTPVTTCVLSAPIQRNATERVFCCGLAECSPAHSVKDARSDRCFGDRRAT
jgi:hypothetical protein